MLFIPCCKGLTVRLEAVGRRGSGVSVGAGSCLRLPTSKMGCPQSLGTPYRPIPANDSGTDGLDENVFCAQVTRMRLKFTHLRAPLFNINQIF